jgi:hypothetical protein
MSQRSPSFRIRGTPQAHRLPSHPPAGAPLPPAAADP